MHWVAPSERDIKNGSLEKHLWAAADQFRTNSGLTPQQHARPILGLIFLRFADVPFAAQSARFVTEDKKNPTAGLAIHGVEKTDETSRLWRMNVAA